MDICIAWARGSADAGIAHVYGVHLHEQRQVFCPPERARFGLCGAWLGDGPVRDLPDDCRAACADCIARARAAFDPGPVPVE